MMYLNLFRSKQGISQPVKGCFVRFEGLTIDEKTKRRAFLQSIVSTLSKRGLDGAVAPRDMLDSFDIVFMSPAEVALKSLEWYRNLGPRLVKDSQVRTDTIQAAWQNKVRAHLKNKGFLKVADQYVVEKNILDRRSIFKKAFRVQTVFVGNCPALWIDPKSRVMIPLTDAQIEHAASMGEESSIRVRVLPSWQSGILVGRTGKKADEMEFPIGSRFYRTPEYWKRKNDIAFVRLEDEMLEVYLPSNEKTGSYPRTCVFSEFQRGMVLPNELKKSPEVRVGEAVQFLKEYFSPIVFLNQNMELAGPIDIGSLNYSEQSYPSYREITVVLGQGKVVPVSGIHQTLKEHGPYAGRLDGKCVVFHSSDDQDKISKAFEYLRNVYSDLNLGKLELFTEIGKNGLVYASGDTAVDFTSAVAEARPQMATASKQQKVIALIVLPNNSSQIYFKSRDRLFDRLFGLQPVPAQGISEETIDEILKGRRSHFICANTASQCYVKLGGTGYAVWILNEAADKPIHGITPGSTCYAYHDVSRRPKLKASATAYSAMTDSYGRYIATGTKPIGGERLTPSGFYDILVELLQKIAIFAQKYSLGSGKLNLQRLVFAKDGVVGYEEAEMMEQVINEGIRDEKKEPLKALLQKPLFPKTLIIDIIGVNKSPNKRIFDLSDTKFINVNEGTAVCYNHRSGLLVSCSPQVGTSQPLEISLEKHICLNREVTSPHISQIMEEYHRLTHLDWASLFKQGKYALPQILTQNLGENISAGVLVPDDMILL